MVVQDLKRIRPPLGTSRSPSPVAASTGGSVIKVCSLGEQLLMACADRLSDSCLGKGVLKVLAGEAHHEGSTGP